MNAHWWLIQHVAWEGPGLITTEAGRRGIPLHVARVDLGDGLPDVRHITRLGGLIVMGGPMSVNDITSFPILVSEKRLLAAAVEAGIPVLGICLGAQLLANALGAPVYRATAPEVGFGQICLTPEGVSDPALGPDSELPVIHWHEETFDLPSNATLLATTELCRNQAFRIGSHVYGFQFHVEVDAELADVWDQLLPEGISLRPSDREKVERAGRRVIGQFFETVANNNYSFK